MLETLSRLPLGLAMSTGESRMRQSCRKKVDVDCACQGYEFALLDVYHLPEMRVQVSPPSEM